MCYLFATFVAVNANAGRSTDKNIGRRMSIGQKENRSITIQISKINKTSDKLLVNYPGRSNGLF